MLKHLPGLTGGLTGGESDDLNAKIQWIKVCEAFEAFELASLSCV